MDDARLCVAVLQTASRHGAILANYVEAVDFEKQHGTITGVRAIDRLSGQSLLIRSRVVLNATGPWADAVCKMAGDDEGPHLQPTKGVHLIVPDLGHRQAFLLLHPRDGRVFFVIPWLGKTLIGTTDTLPETTPDTLNVQQQEIDYLLDGYNHHFEPNLDGSQVLGTFAGLRPLVRSRPGEPSARSREFRLHVSPSGLVSALGGKYSTFRQMAETIVDFLGNPRRCRTRSLSLEGAPSQPWSEFYATNLASLQKAHPIAADSAAYLLGRHGTGINDVLAAIQRTPHGFARVHPEEPDLVGESTYLREEEMAISMDDVYLRRSRIGMWRPDVLRG